MQLDQLQFFAKFIEKELGIVYSEHNYFQLQVRLEEIAKFYNLKTVDEVFLKAREGITGNFKELILDVATNNETSFFRDPRVFQAIEKVLLPQLLPTLRPAEQFAIWSAASSNGQEPYSIAMMLTEMRAKMQALPVTHIEATDISTRVLNKAKSGRYSQIEVQRGLSTPLLLKYFSKDAEDYWTVKPEIRNMVRFRQLNLKSHLVHDRKYHLILCRNVLIYQAVESKAEIVKRMIDHLHPQGYLVLGAGESLLGVSQDFEQVPADGVVLYRLKNRDSLKKVA